MATNRKIAGEATAVLAPNFDPEAPRHPLAVAAKKIPMCIENLYMAIAKNEIGFVKIGRTRYVTDADIAAYIRRRYNPPRT
jgi:hypothetical protein